MDKFTALLTEQFNVTLPENLERRASYYRAMDFLEYVAQDTTVVADRVDGFLTVLWNSDQSEVIGFRLKGFQYFFNNFIQPAMQLRDEEFNPLVFIMEALFTAIGNKVIVTDIWIDDSRRERAYQDTVKLIRRDKVSLPPELQHAA